MNSVNYEAGGESSSEVSSPMRRGRCERLRGYTGWNGCIVLVVLTVLVVVMVSVGAAVGVNRSMDGE